MSTVNVVPPDELPPTGAAPGQAVVYADHPQYHFTCELFPWVWDAYYSNTRGRASS